MMAERFLSCSCLEEPSQRTSVFDAFRRSLLDDIHTMILSTHIKKQVLHHIHIRRQTMLIKLKIDQSCPRVGWTRRSGRVGSGPDFAGFCRVGSGQRFGFLCFSLIISWYLNRYETSNTAFGLIDFLRYLIYNN